MSFRFEQEMARPARAWLESRGLLVKSEFPTPWGICDLVGCALDTRSATRRLKLGQRSPIGSLARVRLLSIVPEGRPISLETLSQRLGGFTGRSEIAHEMDQLVAKNFVEITRTGMYLRRNGWEPLHKRIVALELKLRRLTDALNQAIAHLEFADEAYVGLPAHLAEQLALGTKRQQFLCAGIGVLAVGRNECRVVLPASRRSHGNPALQTYFAERFWRTYLKDIST
ncbi:MAG: hypothetical protein FJ279_03955 [Planctomycetes bacterium]|nr:hypothetical protein [Planctomycetota bacterium]